MTTIELKRVANVIRQDIISMLVTAKSGHPGGSLSAADIVATLFFNEMRINPKDPKWADRDRFVLSKGHAAPVLYSALAEKGYFSKEELKGLRQTGHMLQGHPDMKKTPGVDMSTGSLGQGLSAANGMALAGKLDGKDYRVYALLGDGEMAEGQVWEAAMASAHYKLDNVTAIIDYNGLQIDGKTDSVMCSAPLLEKWQAFCWHVIEVDGHDIDALLAAFAEAKTVKGKPTMIIAKTVKGKGVSFMEDQAGWHGNAPSVEQGEQALKELREEAANLG
ncbi:MULTISPECIES: transketolase [Desulfosporosinus]|uniref:Transketolase n=1 Tax=Desulfosporosinus lacus DSM 15449 TaxID=1121420 RepID=A0A1M5R6H8_9FIRM|nr:MULTISPECIES: transketolase [Desulfosporosinus]MCO5386120.1 transketolase [Desulfosporosinus sp.]MDA8220510.1 transketolase [Desulfitobacterium hafniense]SHH21995.1 transketolase [Desulfosporosinus lacus DSM 15449]